MRKVWLSRYQFLIVTHLVNVLVRCTDCFQDKGKFATALVTHICSIHHVLSQEVASAEVLECFQLFLLAATFNAAIQHFGSSMPSSLLRLWLCSKCGWPLSAVVAVLAQLITVTSSHLGGGSSVHVLPVLTSAVLPLTSNLVFLYSASGFKPPQYSVLQCKSCHSCRGSDTLWPGLLLLRQGVFHFG